MIAKWNSTLHNMTALYDDCRHADLSVNCQTEFHHITKQSNYSHTFVIQVIQIPNLVKKKKKKWKYKTCHYWEKKKFWPPVLLKDMTLVVHKKYCLRQCGLLCKVNV